MHLFGQNKYRREMYNRDYLIRNPFRNHPKKAKPQRIADPKEFSDVYQNPLYNLMPLIEHYSGIKAQDVQEREKEVKKRFDRHRNDRYVMEQYYERKRSYEQQDEYQAELYVEDAKLQILEIIRRQHCRTFVSIKEDIINHLKFNKERMTKSRIDNVNFIQNNLEPGIRAYDLLNYDNLSKKWTKIEGIIMKKLTTIQQSFKKNQQLLTKPKQFEKVFLKMLKNNKNIPFLKQLNQQQQSIIFNMTVTYLALPTFQMFHKKITDFQNKSRQIFDKLNRQENELKRVIMFLPYKESSFYWEKIIECCRYISECDHYRDLDDRRVDSFEAEYAGIVTNEVLKRLRENEWLDNSITSAVIEYLRQVEGANNYHNDSNFRVCLFTHSQTDIFVNSQGDADNYFAYQKLIFLVNIPNSHWFVITVYTKRNQIVVYDSLNNYIDAHKDYCEKIVKQLRKKRPQAEFKQIYFYSPKQNNQSDCGVFSIINIICAFDKGEETQVKNNFQSSIVPQIRHSLFLFLLYLGYCKRFQVVPRKDYFDILFRSTISMQLTSKLHEEKCKKGR